MHTGVSATLGDLNGDGFDDIVIGAFASGGLSNAVAETGEVYVIFGKATWTSKLQVSSLDGTNGFTIYARDNSDLFGGGMAVCDYNGDGIKDLAVGALWADGYLNSADKKGDVYVIFGKRTAWSAVFDLATLDGSNGFAFHGTDAGDEAGGAVSLIARLCIHNTCCPLALALAQTTWEHRHVQRPMHSLWIFTTC
jgi:hypothetical protein